MNIRIKRCVRGMMIVGLFVLCSCAHMPATQRDVPVVVPKGYASGTGSKSYPDRWWLIFKDDKLSKVVEEALGNNLALKQVQHRLEQAHAIAEKTGAELMPVLSVDGRTARYRSLQMDSTGSKTVQTADQFDLTMAASYEIDLWGRIAATKRAAVFDVQVAQDNLDTAAMTLVAQITDIWYQIASFDERRSLLQSQIKNNENQVKLQELRFKSGHATALDVLQQREQLAALRTLLPRLEAASATSRHQLAVLLGRSPQMIDDFSSSKLPELPALPDPGVPADLLMKRPDVKAALKALTAADERVAAAVANRLPTLSLTASGGYSSAEASDLFDDWLWNIAGNILAPVLDGGSRKAEVKRTHAKASEHLARFGEVLLNAMLEVENALVNERKQNETYKRQVEQHEATMQSLKQARLRHQRGLADYFFVLNALAREQSVGRSLIETRRAQIGYRIQLHRALGGQWMRSDLYLATSPKGNNEDE